MAIAGPEVAQSEPFNWQKSLALEKNLNEGCGDLVMLKDVALI